MTTEIKDAVISDYKNHTKVKDISSKYKISDNQIYHLMEINNVHSLCQSEKILRLENENKKLKTLLEINKISYVQ